MTDRHAIFIGGCILIASGYPLAIVMGVFFLLSAAFSK